VAFSLKMVLCTKSGVLGRSDPHSLMRWRILKPQSRRHGKNIKRTRLLDRLSKRRGISDYCSIAISIDYCFPVTDKG